MDLGFALALLGGGGAFLLLSFAFAVFAKRRKAKCTASAKAVIVDFKVITKDGAYYYHPIYEFAAADSKHRKTASALSGRTPGLHEVVPVRYNPADPRQSYLQGYDSKAHGILTAVFAIVGCAPIAACICLALIFGVG